MKSWPGLAVLCWIGAALVGEAGLFGWMGDLPVLTSFGIHYFPMAKSEAVLLVVTAFLLVFYVCGVTRAAAKPLACFAMLFAVVLALLKLTEFSAAAELGVERIFELHPQGNFQSIPLGRMSPVAALVFLLQGLALFLLLVVSDQRQRAIRFSAYLTCAAMIVSGTVLLGYLHGTPLLYGGSIIPMALPTAISFFLLGLGTVAAIGPHHVPLRAFMGNKPRAQLLRAFLPVTLIAALAHGLLYQLLPEALRANVAIVSALSGLVIVAVSSFVTSRVAMRLGGRMEQAEAQQRESLRSQRLQSLGTLASGIAHDVNNALMPIMFGTELLRETRLDETQLGFVDQVAKNAERVRGIMRQILMFVGRMEPGKHTIDIKALIAETEEMLNHTLPKNIDIRVAFSEDLRPVTGDETQLSQVLMNLCINARDAMPGGGHLKITCENVVVDPILAARHAGAVPGPYVRIAVADSGTGIPPEILDKIFDPFFTTKEQGKGTGLGLSTVLGIVKATRGFLSVYSDMGRGTRITIWLPALELEETKRAERPIAVPRGHGEMIMVVDDEDSIRDVTKAILETSGYRVLTCADGQVAVQIFTKNHDEIKAVFCDMMMPSMDGAATIREIKRIDSKVQVIAMSGLIEDRAGDAKSAGAGCLIQKPFSADTLLRTLALFVPANK